MSATGAQRAFAKAAARGDHSPVPDDFSWLPTAMTETLPMEVEVQDAGGDWHEAYAVSAVEGTHMLVDGRMRKVHDFPVIWVSINDGERVPWPIEYVRPRRDWGVRADERRRR